MEIITHTFKPVYNAASRILILGTMPSPKSRETGFYYGHPRNIFWKVLPHILDQSVPITIEQKREFLLRNGIAVWDVLHSCGIRGAADSSIKNPVPNDIRAILTQCRIRAVYCNGNKAAELYRRYCQPFTGMPCVCLPSTSPANCRYTFEQIAERYSVILTHITG